MPTETPVIVNQEYLQDIADAIRTKNNSNDTYTPAQMATAISNISGGGGGETLPSSMFDLRRTSAERLFSSNRWQYLVENHANDFLLSDLSNMSFMFCGTQYNIPTNLSISGQGTMGHMFEFYTGATLPSVSNSSTAELSDMFRTSYTTIPANWFANITLSSSPSLTNIFSDSWIPSFIDLNVVVPSGISTTSSYLYRILPFSSSGWDTWYGFSGVINIPVISSTSSNIKTWSGGVRAPQLKRLAFRTNNGAALSAVWKNITLDLSKLGYWESFYINKTYMSRMYGLPYNDIYPVDYTAVEALEIVDATSYAQLKNTYGAWTQNSDYSFYNKVSALETINTLPDISASGTATIKFKGTAGQYTDGGAINTLTSAEIAIASAKGWTVTLV